MASDATTGSSRPARGPRPETFADARDKLTRLERMNISFIRTSFENPLLDRFFRACQRWIGAGWVYQCTKHLLHVHGLDRIRPLLESDESFIVVANHRSYFDMYVVNTVLYRAGFRRRLLFPVRSKFFYDHPLGFFVNAIMSFFSMYPPVFRDRKRAILNHVAFGELAKDLARGRCSGIHPEGTRKQDDDPYTFLPAQSGVGRLIHLAHVKVLPVFVNGLCNDLRDQVKGNFSRRGERIHVVFGDPVDFGELVEAPPGPKTFKAIAEAAMGAVGNLGQEEKALRADGADGDRI